MILLNAVKVTFTVLVSLMMVAVPFTLTSESYASSDGSLDRALLIGGSIIGVMAFGMLLYFMLRRDTT